MDSFGPLVAKMSGPIQYSTTALMLFRRYFYPVVLGTVLWHILDASLALWLWDGVVLRSTTSSSLVNQTIWITGASSGIGASVVCELVRVKARHVVLSARRVEKMQQVIDECQSSSSSPTTFSIVRYDAMDEESTASVVEDALMSTPDQSIDILILNSGIYQIKPATDNRRISSSTVSCQCGGSH